MVLTALPGSCFPHVKPVIGFDKVVHICMYAGFAFLCLWGYREPYSERDRHYRRRAIVWATAIGICYGALTEIMQETICYQRTGSWYDWFADIIGTGIGIAFFAILYRVKNKNGQQRVM